MKKIKTIIFLVFVLCAVFAINTGLFQGQLNRFGIMPRELNGLAGIVFSPFLHGSVSHLLNNIVGLSIFALITMTHGIRYFWRVSFLIIVLGGFGVWLFGRNNVHIGASGWIFGLWALSIANAWYNRSLKTFLIAIVVILLWGGMILGVLPSQPQISFEAHLFGALAGVLIAAKLPRQWRRK